MKKGLTSKGSSKCLLRNVEVESIHEFMVYISFLPSGKDYVSWALKILRSTDYLLLSAYGSPSSLAFCKSHDSDCQICTCPDDLHPLAECLHGLVPGARIVYQQSTRTVSQMTLTKRILPYVRGLKINSSVWSHKRSRSSYSGLRT